MNEKKKTILRDLTGPEKHKIFKQIQITKLNDLFPDFDSIIDIQRILVDFYEIYTMIVKNQLCHENCKERTQLWLAYFLRIYPRKYITLYIHAFVAHLHHFIELYGNINLFNQQGNSFCVLFFSTINKVQYNF
jgi:hypothetical protein